MSNKLEQFIGTKIGQAKSLGWFGFSADPPTLAHRAVIDAALGSGLVQKVVVFPAGKLPYKDFQTSDWERADMSELWRSSAQWDDEVIISRFDMSRETAIAWIDLWKKLNDLAPKNNHYFIVGSDQYTQIQDSWQRGSQLLKHANFIIVPRQHYPLRNVLRHHHPLNTPAIPGSSTAIRQGNLEQVDEMVGAYILENQLYQQR